MDIVSAKVVLLHWKYT